MTQSDELNNYRFFNTLRYGDFLIIESYRLEETLAVIDRYKVSKVYLSRFHGYEHADLKPLLSFSFIEAIEVQKNGSARGEIDLTGIEQFHNLTHLRVDQKTSLNFSHFPKLEHLNTTWHKKLFDLHACQQLKELYLWHFNPPEKDFSWFPTLTSLEHLEINWTSVHSFNNFKPQPRLKKLSLDYASRLTDCGGIEVLANSLEILILGGCKSLNGRETLTHLRQLKKLGIMNCKALPDVKFAQHIPSLKTLRLHLTNIEDGDLAPLEGIENVFLHNKKHYSYELVKNRLIKK
jgi:hypothetical protein